MVHRKFWVRHGKFVNETGLRGKGKSLYKFSAMPQDHILPINVQKPREIEIGGHSCPRRSLTGCGQVKVEMIIACSEDYAMRLHTLCESRSIVRVGLCSYSARSRTFCKTVKAETRWVNLCSHIVGSHTLYGWASVKKTVKMSILWSYPTRSRTICWVVMVRQNIISS